MAKKITKLTDAQVAKFDYYVQKWLDIGLSAGYTDREASEAGITLAYKTVGLKPPKFIWVDNPLEGAKMAAKLTGGSVKDSLNYVCYGSHEASWFSFYDFFMNECGIKECENLQGLIMASACGWWWPFEDTVVASEKPLYIKFNSNQRLHCVDGPAISYKGDFNIYCWDGIRITKELAENPITLQQIESEDNIELRRVMIDKYGQDKYILDSGAEELHRDDWGILYKKEVPNDVPIVMVKVVNSTKEPDGTYRDYFLRVDPQIRPMFEDGSFGKPQKPTAKNAVASTFGMKGSEYNPTYQS